jgi:hypothetical protein
MLKQTLRDYKDQIQYGLIGVILLVLIVNVFFLLNNREFDSILFSISITAFVLLSIFYIYISDKQLLFIVSLGSFAISMIYMLATSDLTSKIANYLSAASFIVSGIAIGLLAFKHSKEFKNFETMEGILAVFLFIAASRYFIETEFSQYYSFAICFLIATLMYNNNLWERYKSSEKNLLLFLLVYFFAEVIKVSGDYISF